jgi:hypothetical protein
MDQASLMDMLVCVKMKRERYSEDVPDYKS